MATYRMADFPTSTPFKIGAPIVVYLDRSELIERGWSPKLINKHLRPDATRYMGWIGWNAKQFFLASRVIKVEKSRAVADAIERLRQRRQQEIPRELKPLALYEKQLIERGWTKGLIRKFLPSADEITTTLRGVVQLFAASRIERIEKSEPFREAISRLTARREKLKRTLAVKRTAEAQEREIAERKHHEAQELEERAYRNAQALKLESLRATFPGFNVSFSKQQIGNGVNVCVGQRGSSNVDVSVMVMNDDFSTLVRSVEACGSWMILIDWLMEHEVGNHRFRAALPFLATGDADGWKAWLVHEREQRNRPTVAA